MIVGAAIGALLAGQEWRTLSDERGRAPTRQDLRLGLTTSITGNNGDIGLEGFEQIEDDLLDP